MLKKRLSFSDEYISTNVSAPLLYGDRRVALYVNGLRVTFDVLRTAWLCVQSVTADWCIVTAQRYVCALKGLYITVRTRYLEITWQSTEFSPEKYKERKKHDFI